MKTGRAQNIAAAEWVVATIVASTKLALVMVGLGAALFGQTKVFRNGQWQQRGRQPYGQVIDEFQLGVTQPTANTTSGTGKAGIRAAKNQTIGVAGSNSTYTISTAGIYERLEVFGRVVVTIATGVTIQDCQVKMGTYASPGQHAVLFDNPNAIPWTEATPTGNLIQFCNISIQTEVAPTEWQSSGIRGRGFTAYRNDISGVVDGFHLLGKTGATEIRIAYIWGNIVHDLTISVSAGQADGFTHNDCIQCFGFVSFEAKGNTFFGGRTSCIILNVSVSGGYGFVYILLNWLYGFQTGGATINVSTSGNDIPDLKVWQNRVDKNGFDNGQITVKTPNLKPASFGAISGTTNGGAGSTNDWVYGSNKNTYMQDGLEVRVQVG